MPSTSPLGPFRPGFGGQPPYLAGREAEQQRLRGYLGALSGGAAPGTAVVLHGPRGNGKTVLLGWLKREATQGSRVETATLQPAGVADEARLRELLLPQSWWDRLAAGGIGIAGFSGKLGEGRAPPVAEILAARAKETPVLLLVDEAHTLDERVGGTLLNASQLVGRSLPFLLVLAGTPNLRSHLNTMNASFWNRTERRPIGRLDAEATAAAIRRPLESEDIAIDGDALEHVVRESHGYPYFVQVWGQALWRQVSGKESPETGRHLTQAAGAAAETDFDREKNDYYLDRYEELEKLRLLPVAREVAGAFRAQPLIDDAQLEAAVLRGLREGCGKDTLAAAKQSLRHLGYIWRPEATPMWEPGIPSLMDYVREYAPTAPVR